VPIERGALFLAKRLGSSSASLHGWGAVRPVAWLVSHIVIHSG
jgi:hypothetical protein